VPPSGVGYLSINSSKLCLRLTELAMERNVAKAVCENYNTNLHVSALYLLTRLVLTILIENKIFPGFEVHVTYEEFC